VDAAAYDDDPERVGERLRRAAPGDWFVFETFAADGSLAIGVARGSPSPEAALIVYAGLSREVAAAAAGGLARWHRRQGRAIDGPRS
jgi:hypothetical protein